MNGDKNSYWFPHDTNAHRDEKTAGLIMRLGYEGYGMFWALIETLAEATGYRLKRDRTEFAAWQLRIDGETFESFIETCTGLGLIEDKDGYISSPSLTRRMQALEDARVMRKERARMGGEAKNERSTGEAGGKQTGSTNEAPQNRAKDSIAEEIYERYKKQVRAGARQDAIKNIQTQLGEYTRDELLSAVETYAALVKRNKTDDQYRIQANNFFGIKARFKDYLQSEQTPPPPPPPINPDLPPHLRGAI